MKIAVNSGHTINGKGYGAVGFIRESEETRKVVEELIPLLKKKGHKVVNATVDTSTNYTNKAVSIANNAKADLFISIHFNAGGGRGVEVFTWKGRKISRAINIARNISDLGFKNRGVKDGSNFYVIKKTNMQSLLIEVCFVDSLYDTTLYCKLGAKKIAKAIADSI